MTDQPLDGVNRPGEFWDAKYHRSDYFYGVRPNAFLVDQDYRLDPGSRILCIGDGEGRNGVWLAEQGHNVTSVDVSPRALQKCAELAMQRGVFLRTECADLRDWHWPTERFDAVVAIYVHLLAEYRKPVHLAAINSLKPGGLFLLEAFNKNQLGNGSGGPKKVDLLYTADELREDFPEAEILSAEDLEIELDEGPGHSGRAAVTRLLARRR